MLSLAVLTTLAAVVSSTAWLWLLLAAVAFLLVHSRTRSYAALVVGCVLAGAAVGTFLEVALRWQGAFLVSVGTAALLAELLEPRKGHWPFVFGVAFLGVGAVVTLSAFGPRGYLAACLAAALGAAAWAVRRPR